MPIPSAIVNVPILDHLRNRTTLPTHEIGFPPHFGIYKSPETKA